MSRLAAALRSCHPAIRRQRLHSTGPKPTLNQIIIIIIIGGCSEHGFAFFATEASMGFRLGGLGSDRLKLSVCAFDRVLTMVLPGRCEGQGTWRE